MDAFFAAVEQRDHPEYRGLPVVIGAKPGNRGVVSTCSYEARKFGVHSAMPISIASRKLPDTAVYLHPNMKLYKSVSDSLMNIFREFSPSVEPLSIDEAFLDMTGVERLMGSISSVAEAISQKIKSELNLTASIGVGPNKFLAKLASDMLKPDGITITPFNPTEIVEFMKQFPVTRLWGVGASTEKKLSILGIHTVEDLQKIPEELLIQKLGKTGSRLSKIRFGIDNRSIDTHQKAKSISREHTFLVDQDDRNKWRLALLSLCDDIAHRARKKGVLGRTITLTWRTTDFARHSASKTVVLGLNSSEKIFAEISILARNNLGGIGTLRLIGAGISKFDDNIESQTSLFDTILDNPESISRVSKKDQVIDEITARFGSSMLVRGHKKEK